MGAKIRICCLCLTLEVMVGPGRRAEKWRLAKANTVSPVTVGGRKERVRVKTGSLRYLFLFKVFLAIVGQGV